jgi:hypothetical protein
MGSLDHKPVVWVNSDVMREFIALLEPQVQYAPRDLKAGFGEMDIAVNGVTMPFKIDYKCPSYVYIINPEYIDFYNSRPLGLVEDDNGNVQIPNANATNWEYRYWHAWNLGTTNRRAHGCIRDVSCTITSV